MTFRKFLHIYKRHIRLALAGAVAAFAVLIVTWAFTGGYYTDESRVFTTPPGGILGIHAPKTESPNLSTLLTLASS